MLIAIVCEKARRHQALIKQVLDVGYKIALVTKNPEKININHENLYIVKGDAEDKNLLDSMLEHANAVIGLFVRHTPQEVANIISTMQLHDVRRCIFFSEEVEVRKHHTAPKNFIQRTLSSLSQTSKNSLDIIRQSDRDWTIIQAFDNASDQKPHEHIDISANTYDKAEKNFAKFMVGQIADATHISKVLSI